MERSTNLAKIIIRQFAAPCLLLLLCSASMAQLRIHLPGYEPAPASCQAHLPLNGAGRDLASAIEIAPVEIGFVSIRYVTAGGVVFLDFKNLVTDPSATISVSVKERTDEGSFRPVCRNVPLLGLRTAEVEARSPRDSEGSLWRIVIMTGSGERSSGIIQVFRPTGSEISQFFPALTGSWSIASGYLCLPEGLEPYEMRRSNGGFSKRVRLDLDIDPAADRLTDREASSITDATLRATSLWAASCTSCRPENMAIVSVAGVLMLREGLDQWLKTGRWSTTPADNASASARDETDLESALEPETFLTAGPEDRAKHAKKVLAKYVAATPADRIDVFCQKSYGAKTGSLFLIKEALCTPEKIDPKYIARIMIRFREGSTECGDSAEIIACRADNQLTEYNVRDYRFTLDDDREPALGHGLVEISLLHALLHEMGHWIGLGHINGGSSIMSAGYDRSRCIDGDTQRALQSQADQGGTSEGPSAFTLHSGKDSRPFLRGRRSLKEHG